MSPDQVPGLDSLAMPAAVFSPVVTARYEQSGGWRYFPPANGPAGAPAICTVMPCLEIDHVPCRGPSTARVGAAVPGSGLR